VDVLKFKNYEITLTIISVTFNVMLWAVSRKKDCLVLRLLLCCNTCSSN